MKTPVILKDILISDIADEGKSVARHEDMVIFLTGGVPGDIADVQLFKKKKNYAEGKVIRVVKPSDKRTAPFCEHFGTCGGCKWQDMKYSEQLLFKQKQVENAITRIGKIQGVPVQPIIGSMEERYYRNKLEYSFSSKRWLFDFEVNDEHTPDTLKALGYHIPGRFDKVLDIRNCYLQPDPSNQIRLAVKDFTSAYYTYFDPRQHTGYMRNMFIRNTLDGLFMVIVVFAEDDSSTREPLLEHLLGKFPEIVSMMYLINRKKNDSIADQEVLLYRGEDHLIETMEDLKFRIGPKSFYQTNPAQAYTLYKITRELAGLTGTETVYDLYTGTGTIANFVARNAKKVVGVEYVEEAIVDARINSEMNGIHNTVFYSGDMKDVVNDAFVEKNGRPDVIITDPPRAGMHEDVIRVMLKAEPQKIVYVSCNPSTQARDLSLMTEAYNVTRIQPVDMFPHTAHVENVVLLERKSNEATA